MLTNYPHHYWHQLPFNCGNVPEEVTIEYAIILHVCLSLPVCKDIIQNPAFHYVEMAIL